MIKYLITIALSDIIAAIRKYTLFGLLGWQDVRQRYKRSSFGPFWLTISMAVLIGTLGIVFGNIFKSPLVEFYPYLTIGIILWGFISSIVNDGCNSFISSEAIIKQLPLPLFVHILRLIWRNILILAHNIVIVPLVLLIVDKPMSMVAFFCIPGFVLLIVNLTWIALVLGVLCTRFRDLIRITESIVQVAFYLTPVIWMPNLLSGRTGSYVLEFNPAYHLLEIVRSPLLGQLPTVHNWVVSLAMALVGWFITLMFYGRYKRRVAFWL